MHQSGIVDRRIQNPTQETSRTTYPYFFDNLRNSAAVIGSTPFLISSACSAALISYTG